MERDAVHKAIMSLLRQDVKSKCDKLLSIFKSDRTCMLSFFYLP